MQPFRRFFLCLILVFGLKKKVRFRFICFCYYKIFKISKLVILQEEADDGNPLPDLSLPVEVVRKAADNLIRVGYETCESSVNDPIL